MAYYQTDIEYKAAVEIIKNLSNSKKDKLIKYYIETIQQYWDEDKKRLKEYSDFFETLSNFIPNSYNTIYG